MCVCVSVYACAYVSLLDQYEQYQQTWSATEGMTVVGNCMWQRSKSFWYGIVRLGTVFSCLWCCEQHVFSADSPSKEIYCFIHLLSIKFCQTVGYVRMRSFETLYKKLLIRNPQQLFGITYFWNQLKLWMCSILLSAIWNLVPSQWSAL